MVPSSDYKKYEVKNKKQKIYVMQKRARPELYDKNNAQCGNALKYQTGSINKITLAINACSFAGFGR